MSQSNPNLSRRKLLFGAGVLLLSGCEKAFNGLQQNEKFLSLLESAEGANRRFLRLLTRRNKLAQDFSQTEISRCSTRTESSSFNERVHGERQERLVRVELGDRRLGQTADSPFVRGNQSNAITNADHASRLRRGLERDCQMEGCR